MSYWLYNQIGERLWSESLFRLVLTKKRFTLSKKPGFTKFQIGSCFIDCSVPLVLTLLSLHLHQVEVRLGDGYNLEAAEASWLMLTFPSLYFHEETIRPHFLYKSNCKDDEK